MEQSSGISFPNNLNIQDHLVELNIFWNYFSYNFVVPLDSPYVNWKVSVLAHSKITKFLIFVLLYSDGIYLFKVNSGQKSSLLTLNRLHTLFWCFHSWLWTSKCWLGIYFFKMITFCLHRHLPIPTFCNNYRTLWTLMGKIYNVP